MGKTFKLIIFGLVIIFFLFLLSTPWRMTIKSLSLIHSILTIQPTELEPDIITETYPQDNETVFYIFRSHDTEIHPAIVMSLGIHPQGVSDLNLKKVFQELVQNGFVVLAVDSTLLKNSFIDPKEVKNLVAGFEFLSKHPSVDSTKIGFVGLSVGSSLAFLAAADPTINTKVKYVVWTGGYFDVKKLIIEVLSKNYFHQGQIISWDPSVRIQEVVVKNLERWARDEKTSEERRLIEKIISTSNREELESLFESLPPHTTQILQMLSLKNTVSQVKAPIFVLHGKMDRYIPFTHSVELTELYPGEEILVLSERYGHKSPSSLSLKDLVSRDFWQVIWFSNVLLEKATK